MTDAQIVFEALKRPGECWHEPAYLGDPRRFIHNPDFSTPEGFFWMWERLKEKEWFNDFIEKSFEYARKQLQIEGGLYQEPYLKWLISPTALYSAVLAWVKEEK